MRDRVSSRAEKRAEGRRKEQGRRTVTLVVVLLGLGILGTVLAMALVAEVRKSEEKSEKFRLSKEGREYQKRIQERLEAVKAGAICPSCNATLEYAWESYEKCPECGFRRR